MKKQFKMALAALLVFGSVSSAMAEEGDYIYDSIQQNKIPTAERNEILDINDQVSKLIDRLGTEGKGEELQKYSLGQLSFLASEYAKEVEATENADKIDEIWMKAQEIKAEVTKIKAELNIK